MSSPITSILCCGKYEVCIERHETNRYWSVNYLGICYQSMKLTERERDHNIITENNGFKI